MRYCCVSPAAPRGTENCPFRLSGEQGRTAAGKTGRRGVAPETEVLNRLVWQVIEEGRSREWKETLEAFGDETPALQASGEAAARLCEILSEVSRGDVPFAKARKRAEGALKELPGALLWPGQSQQLLKDAPADAQVFDLALAACHMSRLQEEEQAQGILSVTAAGDTTFGAYPEVEPWLSFFREYYDRREDMGFPLRYCRPFFYHDSLTLLNCEGTFTETGDMAHKKYRFKGPPAFAGMFSAGGVELVNLANSHTMDYKLPGFEDTKKALEEAGVGFFGEDSIRYVEVCGKTAAFWGYDLFGREPEDLAERLAEDIARAEKNGAELLIPPFHWGVEYSPYPTEFQTW